MMYTKYTYLFKTNLNHNIFVVQKISIYTSENPCVQKTNRKETIIHGNSKMYALFIEYPKHFYELGCTRKYQLVPARTKLCV